MTLDVALSDLMRRALLVLAACDRAMTPNEIGGSMDLPPVTGGKGQGGRGKGYRHFGDAQRVIFPLNALRRRGLVGIERRSDGLSGTAYALTDEGERVAKELTG